MQSEHFIPGKEASPEQAISSMQTKFATPGFTIEEYSWLNPVDGVSTVLMRDQACHLMPTNGKGAAKLADRPAEILTPELQAFYIDAGLADELRAPTLPRQRGCNALLEKLLRKGLTATALKLYSSIPDINHENSNQSFLQNPAHRHRPLHAARRISHPTERALSPA